MLPFRDAIENEEHGDHEEKDEHADADDAHGHDHDGLDPANADSYRANALAGQAEFGQIQAELTTVLAGMQGKSFVTLHDAFQYFEARFGLVSVGTVSLSKAVDPRPAHLSQLRDRLVDQGVTCAFAEPQFDPGLLEAAIEKQDINIITLDPIGSQFEPGPDLYASLLRDMAKAFAECAE